MSPLDLIREPGKERLSLGRTIVAVSVILLCVITGVQLWRGGDAGGIAAGLIGTIIGGYLIQKWRGDQ